MNNITVIRTKRKTISIKVNNDLTVTVRAPIFTSDKEIGEILKSKEKWISKCIEQIKSENEELSKIDYFTAEEISKLADKALDSGQSEILCGYYRCYIRKNNNTKSKDQMGKL